MKSSQITVGQDYAWKVPDPYTKGQYDTYRVRVVGLGKPREVEVTKTYETTWGRKRTEKTGEVRTSKRADGVTIVKCNIDGTVKMKDSVRPDMLVVPARQIWKPWKEYYRRQLKGAVNCLAARCSENRHKHAISEVARILSEIGIPATSA